MASNTTLCAHHISTNTTNAGVCKYLENNNCFTSK